MNNVPPTLREPIDIVQNPREAAEIFVRLCKENPDEPSILEFLTRNGFSQEELRVLAHIIPALTIYCQTSLRAAEALHWQDMESRLVGEVTDSFSREAETLNALKQARKFPWETYHAVTAYLAWGVIEDRPLSELLGIRNDLNSHTGAMKKNLERAILVKLQVIFAEGGINAHLKEYSAAHLMLRFAENQPRATIEAMMEAQLGTDRNNIRWYYLFNGDAERSGQRHAEVNGVFIS